MVLSDKSLRHLCYESFLKTSIAEKTNTKKNIAINMILPSSPT
ncbi:hypothetical protein AO379_1083 [Moraxella catarrhalis]|nr:hypothetical protein AO379_1083 [Moraxella catarrhalis]